MFSCIKCVAYKILFYKKGKSTEGRISVYPPTNVSTVSRPNVSPKIKKRYKHSHDYSHVYNLRQFFETCAVTFSSPLGSVESKVKEEIVKEVGNENDDDYDIRDHLDTVPIPMPKPLNWKDYVYRSNNCNVIYDAPQGNNTSSVNQLLASFTTGITENNPNVSKTTVAGSVPPVPPSFQDSVSTLAEEFLKLIPVEINGIISNLPEGNREKVLMFICNLGVTPKFHIDQMTQEFQCQLQETQCQNAQQRVEINTLNEQVQSLTQENAVMNTIIDTQIPICKAKFIRSTQTDFTPKIVVNESVPKEGVSSDTQTLTVNTMDFSSQTHICCKERVTSEFQCQVSLSKLPHKTQETQTQLALTVNSSNQTDITGNSNPATASQTVLLKRENQQLREEVSQLQDKYYSSLKEDYKYKYPSECNINDKVQNVDQTEEIVRLKDQLVASQENCNKLEEHEKLVCDKYNSLISEFNSLLPQLKDANFTILELQKTVKDLHHDNYLLNNVLEKICPENDSCNSGNCLNQQDESETSNTPINWNQEEYVMVTDSTAQTEHIPPTSTNSSKITGIDSTAQTTPIQNNDFSAQRNTIPPQKSLSPTKRTKGTPSRRTSLQPNIPISQIRITTNFKRFKCAWCSEEKHPWDECQQWHSWNLWQKQQAVQILENVKKGNLHPNVPVKPQFQPQRRALFSPIQVKRNNDSLSKIQWEKQMKINENVQEAGLMKVSNSFYVPQCSVVMQGVKSSSLRRGRTTPNSQ